MLRRPIESALRPGVAVTDQFTVGHRMTLPVAIPQRHPQWRLDQVDVLGGGTVPRHDSLREHVTDERGVDETCPRPHVGEISHPHTVRGRCGELTVEQVPSAVSVLGWDGGTDPLGAGDPGQAELAHPTVHRPRGCLNTATTKACHHLAAPVEALGSEFAPTLRIEAVGDLFNGFDHHCVADGSGRGLAGLPGPVGARGDLTALFTQDSADRLDRVTFAAHGVDEPDDQRLRGSSSPTKKVVAAFKIATSSRNRAFSALRRLICSCSSEVVPGR